MAFWTPKTVSSYLGVYSIRLVKRRIMYLSVELPNVWLKLPKKTILTLIYTFSVDLWRAIWYLARFGSCNR